MAGFKERAKWSFNVLINKRPSLPSQETIHTTFEEVNKVFRDATDRVLAPIQARISIDAAMIPVKHVRVDKNGKYLETIQGPLNDLFSLKANIDQNAFALKQDAVSTMLEVGHSVCVPIDVSNEPNITESYDIHSMRIGYVTEWLNKSVSVNVYNELIGARQDIILPKTYLAVSYNPFYSTMNMHNSTLKRLIAKLALLDILDSRNGSSKLDLVLQLPYLVQGEKKQKEAAKRIRQLEEQLYDTRFGIAYVDAAEKLTPLNRPVINTLPEQIQSLTDALYSQLGLTPTVFNGTASDTEMMFYYNRTVMPILTSLTQSMRVAFLSKTAITQGQSIIPTPDIFRMAPLEIFADSAAKFSTNALLSTNELRGVLYLEPDNEADSDKLRNKNLNEPGDGLKPEKVEPTEKESNKESTNE